MACPVACPSLASLSSQNTLWADCAWVGGKCFGKTYVSSDLLGYHKLILVEDLNIREVTLSLKSVEGNEDRIRMSVPIYYRERK